MTTKSHPLCSSTQFSKMSLGRAKSQLNLITSSKHLSPVADRAEQLLLSHVSSISCTGDTVGVWYTADCKSPDGTTLDGTTLDGTTPDGMIPHEKILDRGWHRVQYNG